MIFIYFLNVSIAYKILLITPVTIESSKRNFLKLKLVKSYLLNGLASHIIYSTIFVKKKKKLNIKNLINNFSAQTTWRVIYEASFFFTLFHTSGLALLGVVAKPHKQSFFFSFLFSLFLLYYFFFFFFFFSVLTVLFSFKKVSNGLGILTQNPWCGSNTIRKIRPFKTFSSMPLVDVSIFFFFPIIGLNPPSVIAQLTTFGPNQKIPLD